MKKLFNYRITYIIIGWLLILITIALDTGISLPVYEVVSDKIDKPVRIVLLTDFHSSSYGKDHKVLTDVIDAQSPDVILLAGDIAENIRPHKHTKELLSIIGKKYPCFYVTGNHEEWSGEVEIIKELVRSCGVTVLEGDSVIFDAGGQQIRISGVDNSMPEEQLEKVCQETGDGIFTVLMSHRPDLVEIYKNNGFDLVVSGHAHGGQVLIPWFGNGNKLIESSGVTLISTHGKGRRSAILNGLYAPDQGLLPKYAGGEYLLADGSTEMIVSRGLCKNILPRVFDPPEVVVIDIISR
ncbi:MAG: metallophosphoesterase [Oscillospiraceae bacterium]|nr:metallophosphoesterase [Oscillospiraceae bacterium]